MSLMSTLCSSGIKLSEAEKVLNCIAEHKTALTIIPFVGTVASWRKYSGECPSFVFIQALLCCLQRY